MSRVPQRYARAQENAWDLALVVVLPLIAAAVVQRRLGRSLADSAAGIDQITRVQFVLPGR